MKPKLLFCLTLIIIFVLFFNLKCTRRIGGPLPYFYSTYDVAIYPFNTYILNEDDNFVPYEFHGLTMNKLHYTFLLRYKIDSTEYNDTLDIYTKLEYDVYRKKDTYFLNDLLINGTSIYIPENVFQGNLQYSRNIHGFGIVYKIAESNRFKTRFD